MVKKIKRARFPIEWNEEGSGGEIEIGIRAETEEIIRDELGLV